MAKFEKFEENINIKFKNKELLKTAFTHRSYLNENPSQGAEHNERMEFLGDAVLELIITEYLYKKYPKKTEGDLTSYRAALVNAIMLSSVASEIGMEEFLLLSKGEKKDTGKARQYILANTIEALIGAIYLDQGYDVTYTFLEKTLFSKIESIIENKLWIDSKSLFQEKSQDVMSITPAYKVVSQSGPDHDKHFVVGVYLNNELIAEGEGSSKQEAEQKAAQEGLKIKNWGN